MNAARFIQAGFLPVLILVLAIGVPELMVQLGRLIDRRNSAEVILGRGRKRRRRVGLSPDELQQGVLIGGSPGAGKTTLLSTLVNGLPSEVGCLIVDLKGDRSLPARVGVAPDRVFGLDGRGAAVWNPFEAGNPASWRDVLMATQEWSEPHYRQAAARYLGACLAGLTLSRGEVRLEEVVVTLEQPKRALGLVSDLPDGRVRDAISRAVGLVEAESSLRSGVVGLGNRLALLMESAATDGRFGASGGIDLDLVFSGETVVFSLPAAEFPDEAPAIGGAAIASFCAAGQRLAQGDERLKTMLIVDEAPRLGGRQLREAVAVGRGAGIGSVVTVQDFADLDYVDPGTREAVETGANTWIVMRQVSSAEDIANSFGSKTVVRKTVQRDAFRPLMTDTGMRSEREVDAYRVSPNVIRGLKRGEAVLWRRLRGRLDLIEVVPRDCEGNEERRRRWALS